MKRFLVLFFVAVNSFLIAQNLKFHKATLIFANGNQQKTGYAKVPDLRNKKISFKATKSTDNVELIASDDLASIIFDTESGKKYILESNYLRTIYLRKSGKIYEKITKNKKWFFLDEYDDKMSLYITGNTFKINSKDEFIMKSSGQKGFVGFSYYFKRPNENAISFIMSTSNAGAFGQGYFRRSAAGYFGKEAKITERIMDKEFKSDEVYKLYRAYLKL